MQLTERDNKHKQIGFLLSTWNKKSLRSYVASQVCLLLIKEARSN